MIKNEDTILLRVEFISGPIECNYVRIKKSDTENFDYVTAIKNFFYLKEGSSKEYKLFEKFTITCDEGFIEVTECDDSEVECIFADDTFEDDFINPNVLIEPSKNGESLKISVCELETPTTDY